jgi:hypothetical protein
MQVRSFRAPLHTSPEVAYFGGYDYTPPGGAGRGQATQLGHDAIVTRLLNADDLRRARDVRRTARARRCSRSVFWSRGQVQGKGGARRRTKAPRSQPLRRPACDVLLRQTDPEPHVTASCTINAAISEAVPLLAKAT